MTPSALPVSPGSAPTEHGWGQPKERTQVLGVDVDVLSVERLMERVAKLARMPGPHAVCYVNADCVNRASFDQAYRAILGRADIVYADGMSVVWAARLTSQPLPERITLGDVLPQLCAMCVREGYRLYIVAGEPGVAQRAVDGLRRQFPQLQVAGIQHGYLTPETSRQVVDDIRRCRPDILLVGMGVPKQEKWMWQYREQLEVPVIWGVGALFDYYAGKTPRAPQWMRRAGLEWCFRLLVEPQRLWKRYLLGNAYFILRAMALPLADAVLVSLAWLGVYAARKHLNNLLGVHINAMDPYLQSLPVIVGVWLAAAALLGSYRRLPAMRLAGELEQVGRSVILGLLITMAVAFLLKEADLGRSVILPFGCGMAVLLTASRLVVRACERHLARRRIGLRRTLIIGTGSSARRVREEIESLSIGYEVTGFLSDGDAIDDLGGIVKEQGIQDVFVFSQSLTLNETLNLLAQEELQPVTVHVVAEELEPFSRRVRLGRVAQLPVLELPPPRVGQWYAACKRGCDVVAAAIGVALAAPLLAVIAGLIRWESPGPALFAQQRIGKNGRPFSMYKFRTMRVGTPAYAVAPNELHDPRVTRLGRLLRRWSLDELPQLFNVLRGEMSLVGPRPEMPFLVRQYQPWQRQRLSVAPGLTCLWQVIGRKELPLHTNLEYDLYYVRHRNWSLDLSILLRTLPAVISRRGAF